MTLNRNSKNTWLCDSADSPRLYLWKLPFDRLTKPEQVFFAVWRLEGQINNGGFWQYFWNLSGDTALMAVKALTEIGAPRMAGIVREACALFPNGIPPSDREIRADMVTDMLENDPNAWKSLDERFLGYPEDLTELLYEYVQQHKDQIRGLS